MIITFEGGEGSGKTVQIKLLREALEKEGFDICITYEPGGTPLGDELRTLLLNREDLEISSEAEALMFFAMRAQLADEVTKPALEEGKIVISDRSFYSTYAYQGYARGLDMKMLKNLTEISVGKYKPDLVILLDIDPEIGIQRKNDQNEVNRLDKEDRLFHESARDGFLELAQKDQKRWEVLDATETPELIHSKVLQIVLERLDGRGRKR